MIIIPTSWDLSGELNESPFLTVTFSPGPVPSMPWPNQTYFEHQKDASDPVFFSQNPLLGNLGKFVTPNRNGEKGTYTAPLRTWQQCLRSKCQWNWEQKAACLQCEPLIRAQLSVY